jgi:hypothetical protein
MLLNPLHKTSNYSGNHCIDFLRVSAVSRQTSTTGLLDLLKASLKSTSSQTRLDSISGPDSPPPEESISANERSGKGQRYLSIDVEVDPTKSAPSTRASEPLIAEQDPRSDGTDGIDGMDGTDGLPNQNHEIPEDKICDGQEE